MKSEKAIKENQVKRKLSVRFEVCFLFGISQIFGPSRKVIAGIVGLN